MAEPNWNELAEILANNKEYLLHEGGFNYGIKT